MPIPPLKPLFEAASQAYHDIRRPKDSSTLRKGVVAVGSILGYTDTSAAKKTAFAKLIETADQHEAEAKGGTETQNTLLSTELEALLQRNQDGANFKMIAGILSQCCPLATQKKIATPLQVYIDLQPQLRILRAKLEPDHIFFQELDTFFKEREIYNEALLIQYYQSAMTRELRKNEKEHALKEQKMQATIRSFLEDVRNALAKAKHLKIIHEATARKLTQAQEELRKLQHAQATSESTTKERPEDKERPLKRPSSPRFLDQLRKENAHSQKTTPSISQPPESVKNKTLSPFGGGNYS